MQTAHAEYVDYSDGEIVEIPLNLISAGRLGIRSDIGDLSGLEISISQHGLLAPIIVRRTPYSRFEVIAGNRRLRVFQDLGLSKIRAKVIEADDKESFELFLTENVQRQTLNPLDEARAFYNYVSSKSRHGLGYGSVTELAERIGKSQGYISNRIGLLRLPEPTVRRLLDDRKLTVSHLEELASLSGNPAVAEELATLVSTHRISVRILESTVRLIKSGVRIERALSLAKIESEMRLELSPESAENQTSELLRRTKRVLEAALSYLDNTIPTLEKEPALYKYWAVNVRRPVHKAIDGTIACQKNLAKKR